MGLSLEAYYEAYIYSTVPRGELEESISRYRWMGTYAATLARPFSEQDLGGPPKSLVISNLEASVNLPRSSFPPLVQLELLPYETRTIVQILRRESIESLRRLLDRLELPTTISISGNLYPVDKERAIRLLTRCPIFRWMLILSLYLPYTIRDPNTVPGRIGKVILGEILETFRISIPPGEETLEYLLANMVSYRRAAKNSIDDLIDITHEDLSRPALREMLELYPDQSIFRALGIVVPHSSRKDLIDRVVEGRDTDIIFYLSIPRGLSLRYGTYNDNIEVTRDIVRQWEKEYDLGISEEPYFQFLKYRNWFPNI
jgi:hypothetical protein